MKTHNQINPIKTSIAVLFLLCINTFSADNYGLEIIKNGFAAIIETGAIYRMNNDNISDLVSNEYGVEGALMLGGVNTLLGAKLGYNLFRTSNMREYDNVAFDRKRGGSNANAGLLLGHLFYNPNVFVMPTIGIDWNFYSIDQPNQNSDNHFTKEITDYPLGLTLYIPIKMEAYERYVNAKCIGITIKTTKITEGIGKTSYIIMITYSLVGWSITT